MWQDEALGTSEDAGLGQSATTGLDMGVLYRVGETRQVFLSFALSLLFSALSEQQCLCLGVFPSSSFVRGSYQVFQWASLTYCCFEAVSC